MKQDRFDVVVVGGGHAGTEAALAAARVGASIAMVTHRFDRLGEMSCNPAIGGIGKGHLVREIDALDGAIGIAADRAGIQYRLLNRSRGAATQGPRTQADRQLYRSAIQVLFKSRPEIRVIEGEVVGLVLEGSAVRGVQLGSGAIVSAAATIITTGTFLGGVIHIGHEQRPAGRVGDPASTRLSRQIQDLGLPLGRLKTGTPPRLHRDSIGWDRIGFQHGDTEPDYLSFLTTRTCATQIACGITATNLGTHEIIRKNLGRSAMFSGAISGPGPRYCPSIEDKVSRFAEKDSHNVFLEPEGIGSEIVYPNGISSSLPADVQESFVRSIVGLESARIVQPGYAIEYDYVDPLALGLDLGVRAVPGLFLAGQINGTTGYEEAAAQGVVAGLNAALRASNRDPILMSRTNSYIGVMISDLTTRGVTEPYRMFTSRSEFRLSVRADNADQRLTPIGIRIGCVSEQRRRAFEEKMEAIVKGRDLIQAASVTPFQARSVGLKINQDGRRRTLADLIGSHGCAWVDVSALCPQVLALPEAVKRQLEREARYAPYLDGEERHAASMRRDENQRIPADMDYSIIPGLTHELRQKLAKVRPETLCQAGQIEGMTPAALTILLMKVRSAERAL